MGLTRQPQDGQTEGLGFAVSVRTVQDRLPYLMQGISGPTPTGVRRPTATVSPVSCGEFGPLDGRLTHDNDGFIEIYQANVLWTNFTVNGTFFNPYAASVQGWSYGFNFRTNRSDDDDDYLTIVVTEARRWNLIHRKSDPDQLHDYLASGYISGPFNVSEGGYNRLALRTQGTRGLLYINNADNPIALELSGTIQAGDIEVLTGAFTGHEQMGAVTRFTAFEGECTK